LKSKSFHRNEFWLFLAAAPLPAAGQPARAINVGTPYPAEIPQALEVFYSTGREVSTLCGVSALIAAA
jgi:hypothetical protein